MSSFKRSVLSQVSPTVAVQPAPLNNRDLRIVQAILADVAPEWSVELHGICAEDASLIVLPEDGEDAMGPSFAITRESCGLRLDQIHWDELTEIGIFASLSELTDAMAGILGEFTDLRVPASVTIH
jgi:hypothetical protein